MSKYSPAAQAAAVICELNPLQNGHLRLLSMIRERLPGAAVCAVMSGDFVQRGECAVYDKYKRAELAVRCGFDLVIELPPPYSFGAAERFARGGVGLIDSLGVFTHLAFGCSPGNGARLTEAAARMSSPGFEAALRERLSASGCGSYIESKGEAYRLLYGEDMPDAPNDILAVEYLTAIDRIGSGIEPVFLDRQEGWSATAARTAIRSGDAGALSEIVPPGMSDMLGSPAADMENAFPAIAWRLRTADPEELTDIADVGGGSENLIIKSAREAGSWDELVRAVSGKGISLARARRTLLSCFLGVKASDYSAPPGYALLLAAGPGGMPLLREMKKRSRIKIISRPAEADDRIFVSAEELYSLCFRPAREAGWAAKGRVYISRDEKTAPSNEGAV